jgi:hypothetical protein
MKAHVLILGPAILAAAASQASAFHVQYQPPRSSPCTLSAFVNVAEEAPRNIQPFDEWATACGVQRCGGFQLAAEDGYGQNIGVQTSLDVAYQEPVLFVPANMILSAYQAAAEVGRIDAAEKRLVSAKASDHVPNFYLFLKILYEWEQGDASPYFPWFDAMPRYFSSGSSMTPFCFECLPPLAGYLAMNERVRYIQFFQALRHVEFLRQDTKENKALTRWAFALIYTRGFPTEDGDTRIVPMADYFNHGTDTNVDISFTDGGDFMAYASRDIPAGSPLRMSYGDSTNPSALFAKYGFLDESSPATFCKIMIKRPSKELVDMGYDHSRMVFYKDTGEVSPEVYDVLLYQILSETNPTDMQRLYEAHMRGDVATKQSLHQQYYPQTAAALVKHVNGFLNDLNTLKSKSIGKDPAEHPRLPLIMAHNEFVRETFERVSANL